MSPPTCTKQDPLLASEKVGAWVQDACKKDDKPKKGILRDTTSIKTNETVFDLSLNTVSSSPETISSNDNPPAATGSRADNLLTLATFLGTTESAINASLRSSISSTGSGQSLRNFCFCDQTMDFWMIDDELVGRFSIYSGRYSYHDFQLINNKVGNDDEDDHPQFQHALIFKIKTTSPYHFWVKPIYGLMRPNTVATIEVRCDPKTSTVKMEQDEFLVEVARVPGATAAMTSDLYTSTVASNLPELLNIWEKIELDSRNPQEDPNSNSSAAFKESHRVTCRFHRVHPVRLKLGSITQAPEKITLAETTTNNNISLNTLPTGLSVSTPDKCEGPQCFIAREYYEPKVETDPSRKLKYSFPLSWRRYNRELLPRNVDDVETVDGEQVQDRLCPAIRCLQILIVILSLMLVGSLCYIYYSQYMYHHRESWNNQENTHTHDNHWR